MTLALALHLTLLMVPVPVPQSGIPAEQALEDLAGTPVSRQGGVASEVGGVELEAGKAEPVEARPAAIPYRSHAGMAGAGRQPDGRAGPLPGPLRLEKLAADGAGFHPLSRATAGARLLPPSFSADTIPRRPDKDMFLLVDENAQSYLLGDVTQDAVPATITPAELADREAGFLAELRRDIEDGRLDMPFATFIISAEYYQLSRALLRKNLMPAFTLEEALARFRERERRVTAGLSAEIDAFAAVMILQRYAENKFYPGNGSGMLLDSLFHNVDDCEAGTKEVLAYLQGLYPNLILGSNRGMLLTTTGEMIGHMQVYLGSSPATQKILANTRGLVIETTRIGLDSIQPYAAGEIFLLEDFVARYYPEIVAGTPLAGYLLGRPQPPGGSGTGRPIVGSSDHPLKMNYGASGTLLSDQPYDLANIRTRKLDNAFLTSSIPGCDPRIDPTRIDRTNLFSNFVAIDRKLRKSLIDHYLAGLDYWDNRVMPQWKLPEYVATYTDLAGSLLAGQEAGYLQVDAENTVAMASLASHRRYLLALKKAATPDRFLGTGRQDCRDRTVLDARLLAFLFTVPTGPGFYLLPEPRRELSWPQFLDNVADDCLAVPALGPANSQLAALEEEARLPDSDGEGTSLRRELYLHAAVRGFAEAPEEPLRRRLAALTAIFAGRPGDGETAETLTARHSGESGPEEPSVAEAAAESGRTGINGGLVWDLFDFLGKEKTLGLLAAYAGRQDLRLSVRRAGNFLDTVAAILHDSAGAGQAGDFMASVAAKAATPQLKLAAELARARLAAEAPAAVSAIALRYLQHQPYRADDLLALLRHGLQPEDGAAFVRSRSETAVARLPKLSGRVEEAGETAVELVELVRTIDALGDLAARQTMAAGLAKSLALDLAWRGQPGSAADFGLLYTKLSLLAMLRETCGGGELPGVAGLPGQAVAFAAAQPVGKLMVGLLDKVVAPGQYQTALAEVGRGHFAALRRLQEGQAKAGDRTSLGQVAAILGEGSVLARLLMAADDTTSARIADLLDGLPAGSGKQVAAAYLERLHGRAAALVTRGRGGDAYAPDFYLDDRVREAMAMLAFVQREGEGGERVRFRKIQDIRTIVDPGKIQVIEAERKITRQDMSLLTLALNEANPAPEIRRAWEQTIAVTGRHLGLAPRGEAFAAYLFAPHFPYLQVDDLGFFFSPETVEDLPNADRWGGRNDILLSSYLHFRNMPERLPDWLLRAALARSEFERGIIDKFERESFLPMILECTADHDNLPEGLFRAQWTVRKPYGEDIFPGTLLLLRMGYMTINPEGELVFTAKFAG